MGLDPGELQEALVVLHHMATETPCGATDCCRYIRDTAARRPIPLFDDFVLLGIASSRYLLQTHRGKCDANVCITKCPTTALPPSIDQHSASNDLQAMTMSHKRTPAGPADHTSAIPNLRIW